MVTGKPDGVSNSPSDKHVIRIRYAGAAGEVAEVDLSDGSSFFLPSHLIAVEGLETGQLVSSEGEERLSFLDECLRARRKALDLLAVAEQSRNRLELKLSKRGFSTLAVGSALDELEASGALDDARFARLWLESRIRRNPCGRAKLYAALLGQGLSRRIVEEALSEWNAEDERDALSRAAERLMARSSTTPTKALRSLVALGFSFPQARREVEARFDDGFADEEEPD